MFHALYRTSIKGRRDLIKLLFTDDNDPNAIHKIDKSYTNRVAEIFNVTLKTLGLSLEFVNDEDRVKVLSEDSISDHIIGGEHFLVTDYQAYLIETLYDIRETILEERPVITKSELDKLIMENIEKQGAINNHVKKDLLKILTDSDKSIIKDAQDKFIEDLSKVNDDSSSSKKVIKEKISRKSSKSTKEKAVEDKPKRTIKTKITS